MDDVAVRDNIGVCALSGARPGGSGHRAARPVCVRACRSCWDPSRDLRCVRAARREPPRRSLTGAVSDERGPIMQPNRRSVNRRESLRVMPTCAADRRMALASANRLATMMTEPTLGRPWSSPDRTEVSDQMTAPASARPTGDHDPQHPGGASAASSRPIWVGLWRRWASARAVFGGTGRRYPRTGDSLASIAGLNLRPCVGASGRSSRGAGHSVIGGRRSLGIIRRRSCRSLRDRQRLASSARSSPIVIDGAILYYLNQPSIKSLFGK